MSITLESKHLPACTLPRHVYSWSPSHCDCIILRHSPCPYHRSLYCYGFHFHYPCHRHQPRVIVFCLFHLHFFCFVTQCSQSSCDLQCTLYSLHIYMGSTFQLAQRHSATTLPCNSCGFAIFHQLL